jgi:hypothetical protein
MGRPKLSETKQQIAARVAPSVKTAIEAIASSERRTESQVIEMLLERSLKAKARQEKAWRASS